VVAGVGLVWVVYKLALRLKFSHIQVFLATTTVALSPFMVYYSQEMRAYGLIMVLLTGGALSLVEKRWGTLAVCLSVALYMNNLTVFYGMWLGMLGLWWYWPQRHERIEVVKVGLWAGLAYLPGLAGLIYQAAQVGHGYWIERPGWGRLLAVLDDQLFWFPNSPFMLASAVATALAVLVVAEALLKRGQQGFKDREGWVLVAGMALGPLLTVALISVVWQPVLISRSVAGTAPFWAMLVAWAVGQSRIERWAWGIMALCIAGATYYVAMTGEIGRESIRWDVPGVNAYYHNSVNGYVPGAYGVAGKHYVYPNQATIQQSLSEETRRVMGITADEKNFESVMCEADQWVFTWLNTHLSTPDEVAHSQHMQQYAVRHVYTDDGGWYQGGAMIVQAPPGICPSDRQQQNIVK